MVTYQRRLKLGLSAFWKRYFSLLWRQVSENHDERHYMRALLHRQIESWHHTIRTNNAPLSPQARQYWRFLTWLDADDTHWNRVYAVVQLVLTFFRDHQISPLTHTFCFKPSKQLWAYRKRNRQHILNISLGFALADDNWWHAFLTAVLGGDYATARQLSQDFANSTLYQPFRRMVSVIAHAPVGQVYNLAELFHEINTTYFNGRLDMPTLAWSKRRTYAKLGSYHFNHDAVVISPILDDKQVDREIVSYVVYHELLHRVHGVVERSGRRYVHTPAFRRDEKRFLHYDHVIARLNELNLRNDPS